MAAISQTADGSDIRGMLRTMGRRLQNARRDADLTQRVVADRLEVTPQTVRNWESGRHEPPRRLRQQMAELYGLTTAKLFGQDDAGQIGSLAPHSRVDAEPRRLRLGRERAGLSQIDVAKRSAISRATIGRYERGEITPTRVNLETLAALYRRPIRWFIRQVPASRGREVTDLPSVPGLYADEVTEAYAFAQPDLTREAVRSIADYIGFLHDQELRRTE